MRTGSRGLPPLLRPTPGSLEPAPKPGAQQRPSGRPSARLSQASWCAATGFEAIGRQSQASSKRWWCMWAASLPGRGAGSLWRQFRPCYRIWGGEPPCCRPRPGPGSLVSGVPAAGGPLVSGGYLKKLRAILVGIAGSRERRPGRTVHRRPTRTASLARLGTLMAQM